mmetsp:Transcript_78403/g.243124  ORF Transcript_78403/g.243124 Transcript_78403/m.243124 type:complete len:217 (-) Transcript_78403:1874-2524(-)
MAPDHLHDLGSRPGVGPAAFQDADVHHLPRVGLKELMEDPGRGVTRDRQMDGRLALAVTHFNGLRMEAVDEMHNAWCRMVHHGELQRRASGTVILEDLVCVDLFAALPGPPQHIPDGLLLLRLSPAPLLPPLLQHPLQQETDRGETVRGHQRQVDWLAPIGVVVKEGVWVQVDERLEDACRGAAGAGHVQQQLPGGALLCQGEGSGLLGVRQDKPK